MARRGRKPKHRIDLASYKGVVQSAISLGLMAIGVVSIIAVFAGVTGEQAIIDSKLRKFLVDGFGIFAPFLGLVLIYGGLISIGTLRNRFINKRIFIGLLLMLISLLGALGSLAGGTFGEKFLNFSSIYTTIPGAIFLFLCLFIFAIVLITNTGLSTFFEKIFNGLEIIGEKFLKIKLPEKDEAEEEGEIEEDNKEQKNSGQLTLPSAKDIDFDSPSLETKGKYRILDSTRKDTKEKRDFEIVEPPSTPVGEENGESETESSLIELETENESKEAKHSKKLPFSNRVWEYPPFDILDDIPNQGADAGDVNERAKIIESTLEAFGIKGGIADIKVGPAVTQYALNLSMETKASKIKNLETDFALRLKSPSGTVRVETPIPGTNLVGIEVPNFTPSSVTIKSVLESPEMKSNKNKLAVAIGHDVAGKPIVQDIGRWPHALVAGATGSGKSVMLNAIISTLLFRCSPQECRFIMIDPKLVELSQYNGIPHLLTPVVTDIEQQAVSVFAWAVSEMERRYKLFANAGVRKLDDYNKLSGFQAEPYIMIVVDEIADMMMVAANEIEKYVIRLAQKSRATGIHLILATQRPSVNILTGTIKANVPTRFAFKVTSNTDSRVIIDQPGAERLIGRGDMLFIPPDDSKPRRIQGAFISDTEIRKLVDYLKNTGLEPDYQEEIVQQKVTTVSSNGSVSSGNVDPKVVEALEIIITEGKASASYLQRKLSIGYTRAARMIDEFEDAGIISSARGSKSRDVLLASVDDAIARMSKSENGSGKFVEEI